MLPTPSHRHVLCLGILLSALTALLLPRPALAVPAWSAYHGKTSAEHQAQFTALSGQGYRMTSLSVYGDPGDPRYAAVWVKKDGPPWQGFHGMSGSDYPAYFNTWVNKGYRPTLLSATGSGASAIYAGVFEKDSRPFSALHGATESLFRDQCDWAQNNGYRLDWAAVYGLPGSPLYAGVWVQNTPRVPWTYTLGDTAEQYQGVFNAFTGAGIRPGLTTLSSSGKYLGIWLDQPIGDWVAIHGATSDQYQAELDTLKTQGFYPLHVQGGGSGSDTRYAALFVRQEEPVAWQWNVTGQAAPGLSAFDDWAKALMQGSNVRAASLAIARNGRLVFAHAYTWAEPGYPITQPDSLFRIASCSKPLTSIGIHQLFQQGKLTLNDTAQSVLNLTTPSGKAPVDARFGGMTVAQLLSHLGGWDIAALGFDPMFHDAEVSKSFSNVLPVSKGMIASDMAGRMLSYTPGDLSVYSNFGFSLLGQILEAKGGGRSYTDLMKASIFAPLGVTRPTLGHSLLTQRAPGEVKYHPYTPWLAGSVMTPGSPLVYGPYGGFSIENMDSHGGWIMAPADYAKVLAAFDRGSGNPLLAQPAIDTMWSQPLPVKYPNLLRGWFSLNLPTASGGHVMAVQHNGRLSGTNSLVLHRLDGLSFVLFLNQDVPQGMYAETQGTELNALANKVSAWPTTDLFPSLGIPSFTSSPVIGDLNQDGRLTISDVLLALRGLIGLTTLTPYQQAAADANGDGKLTVQDILLLLRALSRTP
ncbi:MAG TPA: serine hydrolase [Armatimonadota bacterium]|jgi:CubicO group peptidase (beta-lactamase class C family)